MSVYWKAKGGLLAGVAFAALYGAAQAAIPASPGMVNYVEGQVSLNGRALSNRNAGSAEVTPNQILQTNQGKAEMLLTPGAFLRLGDHSRVRMISPQLTDTRVELLQGVALVEVTQLLRGNNIEVVDSGATTRIEKNGLYRFSASPPAAAVYDGKALVQGDDGSSVELKKGRETSLAGRLRADKFNTKAGDNLYAWSSLRSQYLASASLGSARTVLVNGGWWSPGWYWNPWWGMYSFVPADGILYSPFGWGYYSPRFVYFGGPRFVVRPRLAPPALRTAPVAPRGSGGLARRR
jgi:hypothetical protein